jgi:hypothetical protein
MEPAIDLEGTQVYTNGNLAIVRLGEGTIHVYALCPAGKK